jgi:hypothetical protein
MSSQPGARVKFIAMDEPLVRGWVPVTKRLIKSRRKPPPTPKALHSDPDRHLGAGIGDRRHRDLSLKEGRSTDTMDSNARTERIQAGLLPSGCGCQRCEYRWEKLNFDGDMRALQTFFKAQGIPLRPKASHSGLSFGAATIPSQQTPPTTTRLSAGPSAYTPLSARQSSRSSKVGHDGRRLSASLGVHCGQKNHWMCSPADPPYCGKGSMPINLPENNPTIFSDQYRDRDIAGIDPGS